MAFVQRNQATIFLGAGIPFDAAVVAGATLFAWFSVNVPVEVSVIDVVGGGAWLSIGRIETTGGGPRELSLWMCPSATGGATTVTPVVAGTFDTIRALVMEYDDANLMLDRYAEDFGVGTDPSSGATATTTADNELVLGGFTSEFNGTAFSGPGAPWTDRSEVAAERLNVIERFVASTGSFTATGTYAASVDWAAICATFKAAGVAGGGPRVAGGATAGHRRNRLAA
jgi:hypothetical protein